VDYVVSKIHIKLKDLARGHETDRRNNKSRVRIIVYVLGKS